MEMGWILNFAEGSSLWVLNAKSSGAEVKQEPDEGLTDGEEAPVCDSPFAEVYPQMVPGGPGSLCASWPP